MQLWTKHHDPSWDRTVYLCVAHGDAAVAEINHPEYIKVIIVDKGSISFGSSNAKRVVTAPALVFVTDEKVDEINLNKSETTVIFLKPTEIREEFTLERIHSGEFEKEQGRTIYQDYLLLKSFEKENDSIRVLPLSLSAYSKIRETVERMRIELEEQHDDFWPCRSRSYLMELLYFISYVCADHKKQETVVKDDTVCKIMVYLSEHISEKITQQDIIKEFSLNRNLLNALFVKETSQTCMNYLIGMRVNLAQIMLAETELQIGEIAARVGYVDSNYFIKVFKKVTGVTPSKYRESFQV